MRVPRPNYTHHAEQKLKRKNFLPTLVITIILWIIIGGIIYFIDPNTLLALPLFFIATFLTLLFTFSLLFGSQRRGMISALSITLYLFLSYLGVGNIINLLLIVAIAVCVELYLAQK